MTRFRINWGDGPAVEMPPVEEAGDSGGLVVHDTESMLEPLPSSSSFVALSSRILPTRPIPFVFILLYSLAPFPLLPSFAIL